MTLPAGTEAARVATSGTEASEPDPDRPVIALPRPLAFVFSSGAARAASQVGMLDTVLHAGLSPDLAVGSSTGAINAAVFATHPTTAVSRLIEVWSDISDDSALTSMWRAVMRGVTGNQSSRTAAMLAKHLQDSLSERDFDSAHISLQVVATDLSTGMPVSLSHGPVLAAVMASCAFPVMLPPVVGNDGPLTDGSVTAGVPLDQAIAAGARSIVLFDTGASAVSPDTIQDVEWYSVAALAFSHLVRGQAVHDLAEAAGQVPVVVISCDRGSPINLKASTTLFEVGRRVAREALALLPTTIAEPGVYGTPIGIDNAELIKPLLRGPQSGPQP